MALVLPWVVFVYGSRYIIRGLFRLAFAPNGYPFKEAAALQGLVTLLCPFGAYLPLDYDWQGPPFPSPVFWIMVTALSTTSHLVWRLGSADASFRRSIGPSVVMVVWVLASIVFLPTYRGLLSPFYLGGRGPTLQDAFASSLARVAIATPFVLLVCVLLGAAFSNALLRLVARMRSPRSAAQEPGQGS